MTTQPLAEVRRQLASSKAEIEQQLDRACLYLAYPWGRNTADVQAVAAQCGYASAVSARHGALSASMNKYALPRVDIRREYELADFVAAVTGEWDYLKYVQTVRDLLRRGL